MPPKRKRDPCAVHNKAIVDGTKLSSVKESAKCGCTAVV